jgi:hypothetical protein
MDESDRVRVLPRASLGRAWLIAALVSGLPLFSVLYWLSMEQGSWRRVLVVQVILVVIAALIWTRHTGAFTEVGERTVTKQAFFGSTIVPRDRITEARLVTTWRHGSSEAVPQLLLLDEHGHTLLRMDGTFWDQESMERIAAATGVTVTHEVEPSAAKEFLTEHPTAAYFYEGRPWIAILGISLAFATAFVVMSWIMYAIGAPSALGMPLG